MVLCGCCLVCGSQACHGAKLRKIKQTGRQVVRIHGILPEVSPCKAVTSTHAMYLTHRCGPPGPKQRMGVAMHGEATLLPTAASPEGALWPN